MSGVNQVTIVGNVGSAPELSYGQYAPVLPVLGCRQRAMENRRGKTDSRYLVPGHGVQLFSRELCQLCGPRPAARGSRPCPNPGVRGSEGTKHQVMQVIAEKVIFLGAAKRDEQDDRRPSPGHPRSDGREQNPDVPF